MRHFEFRSSKKDYVISAHVYSDAICLPTSQCLQPATERKKEKGGEGEKGVSSY